MTKDLEKLARSLKFDINKEVLAGLEKEYKEVEGKLEALKAFDDKGTAPLRFVDATPTTFLREDVAEEGLGKDIILANAADTDGDFVAITKVVK